MSDKVLVLRTCNADYTSHNGFRWPNLGYVECQYWSPSPENNYGLHGLLWGQGDWSQIDRGPIAIWQVIEVDTDDIVHLYGKVKFRRGNVIYSGSMAEALTMVACHPQAKTETKDGYASIAASSGDRSIAVNGGDRSIAAIGVSASPSFVRDRSIAASSGGSSIATSAGDFSRAASIGNYSRAASGGYGSIAASGGNSSSATANGSCSTAASSGYHSVAASVGSCSTSVAQGSDTISVAIGTDCIVSAGENGCFASVWYCKAQKRFRIRVGYVGRDGIKANTPYRLNGNGQWVEVDATYCEARHTGPKEE